MRRSRGRRRRPLAGVRLPSRSISISKASPPPTASSFSAMSLPPQQPVIDNLRKAGAVILGRTNCPAFSYRWFTTNLIHGDTKNPRDPGLTPEAHPAAREPRWRPHRAYRPRHRHRRIDPLSSLCLWRSWSAADRWRIAAFNASLPERPIGPRSARFPVRWRAPSAISGLRWRRCPARTRAISGGCRRRWKARKAKRAPLFSPTVLRPRQK